QDNVAPLTNFAVASPHIYNDPKLALAVVKALIDAGDWANSHPEELAGLNVSILHQKPEDALPGVKVFNFAFHFNTDDMADLQMVSDFLAAHNKVEKVAPLSSFVAPQFLRQA